MNQDQDTLSMRLKKAYDLSSFNPNAKEKFGDGFMCGMLFVFDAPFAILTIIWNFFFGKFFRIRSVGIIAFNEIYNPKATLGGIIGFVLMGVGIGGWFNTAKAFGPQNSITFQEIWLMVGIILAIINLIGALYVAYKDRQPKVAAKYDNYIKEKREVSKGYFLQKYSCGCHRFF